MGEPPPDPLGEDHRIGPWQRTGAVGEGGRAAERIVGALGKYKSGRMGDVGLGARPQEILRFYML